MTLEKITYEVQKTPFVMVHRPLLQNKKLSAKAKFMLIWLLDKPDDWNCTIEGMRPYFKEGIDSLKTSIAELKKERYLEILQIHGPDGRFQRTHWKVSYFPLEGEKPGVGNTTIGGSSTSNTLCKKEEVKKKKKKEYSEKRKACGPLSFDEKVTKEKRVLEFGRFVRIPEDAYLELCHTRGKEVIDDFIDRINDHIASTGREPYKDYAATIRNWLRREKNTAIASRGSCSPLNIQKIIAEIDSHIPMNLRGGLYTGYNYFENSRGHVLEHIRIGENAWKERVENVFRKYGQDVSWVAHLA